MIIVHQEKTYSKDTWKEFTKMTEKKFVPFVVKGSWRELSWTNTFWRILIENFIVAINVGPSSRITVVSDLIWWTYIMKRFRAVRKSYCTMLQKLSKCEVKAWLCWYLIILSPLWFDVKSSFGEFKRSKNVIFGNFKNSELWIFGKLGTWKLLKFAKI